MKIAMQLASRVHHLRSTGFRDYTRWWSSRDARAATPSGAASQSPALGSPRASRRHKFRNPNGTTAELSPLRAPQTNERPALRALLVAGAGFEPATFGL